MRSLSTGVEIIDVVLGGLTPGLPCVLAGASGSGRTVLSLQLVASAIEQQRVVAMLCNEPAPFLLRQASTLGFDLAPAIRSKRLALLEMDAEIGAITASLGADGLVASIRDEQPLASLLVVDPFSVITAGIFDESQMRSMVRRFVSSSSDWSTVLTVESERLALQQGLERILSENCGAFLRLHRNDRGERRLVVEKTRTGVCAVDEVGFTITQGGTTLVPLEDESAAEPIAPDVPIDLVVADEQPLPERRPPAPESPENDRHEGHEETPSRQPGRRRPRGEEEVAFGDRPVILVVDSDRQSRDLLQKWLEGRYDVVCAEDGFEAMTWMMAQRADLVVLDLLMPRVTGYELLSAFQRSRQSVPRLVLSGRVMRAGDRLAPLVLGATDILQKPVERVELLHKVEMLLRLRCAPEELMDPLEAEDLFAKVAKTRLLAPQEFRARLHRACSLGDRLSLPSSLVAVSSTSSKSLDGYLEAADVSLRFEDATLRVSPRRAVILLVATECADAPTAVERLSAEFELMGGQPTQLAFDVTSAQRVPDDYDWHSLFRDGEGSGGRTPKKRRGTK